MNSHWLMFMVAAAFIGAVFIIITHMKGRRKKALDKVADRADVLTGTFTSAEVGKLYLVLARALGRLE